MHGHKFHQITYPELGIGDGLVIDNSTYTIITDRGTIRQVLVYNDNNLLVNKIAGFNLPNGVEMGYNCGSVLIADYGRGTYLL